MREHAEMGFTFTCRLHQTSQHTQTHGTASEFFLKQGFNIGNIPRIPKAWLISLKVFR